MTIDQMIKNLNQLNQAWGYGYSHLSGGNYLFSGDGDGNSLDTGSIISDKLSGYGEGRGIACGSYTFDGVTNDR